MSLKEIWIDMKLQVIENYLDKKLHEKIQELFLTNRFDWYFISPTATYFDEDGHNTGIPLDDIFIFVHCFVQEFGGELGSTDKPAVPQTTISPYFEEYMKPVLFKMQQTFAFPEPIGVLRIKANMYTNTGKSEATGPHTDFPSLTEPDTYVTMVYHVNGNNGATVVGDRVIPSKANQLIAFDGTCEHYGMTQTDEKVRIVINFNINNETNSMDKTGKKIYTPTPRSS